MKIVRSIRAAYEAQHELNTLLQEKFESIIENGIESKWHYEGRLKSLDSFALKLETGRFNPVAMEDFFACTIVVENADSIQRAEKVVKDKCQIIARRPKYDKQTFKSPDQFPFDDLRLYVKLKEDPALPPEATNDILFEVQIKTFLQHAWAIATHDLIYKADEVSWAQQRIAYQTKAVLESAETAISSSLELSKGTTIDKEDRKTEKLKKTIQLIKNHWKPHLLPEDLIRLARTILDFTEATGISLTDIETCLRVETSAGRGTHLMNLPPYLVIIQSLLTSQNRKFKNFITNSDASNHFKVLITDEVTIPANFPTISNEKIIRC